MGTGRSTAAAKGKGERPSGVRWSVRRKADDVMRLLRGEDLDEVSRELRAEAHRLAGAEFIAAGTEGLKERPPRPRTARLKEAERKIGELTLSHDILRAAARKGGCGSGPRGRGSERGARRAAQAGRDELEAPRSTVYARCGEDGSRHPGATGSRRPRSRTPSCFSGSGR